VNGALVHALNFDAVGEKSGHTAVACAAAPFAMAEILDASGRDLLVAAIVAAEVSARITYVVTSANRRPSETFLAGQLLSHFGAAAGCGRLLGLSPRQMESALGLALMQMSGSRQVIFDPEPAAKSIYGAFPAQAGVIAALLAREGMDASCDVFGAPAGLYPALYGAGLDTASIADGLFKDFRFNDAAMKPWPASNQVIPFIEAAIEICSRGFSLEKAASISLIARPEARPWLEPLDRKLAPENVAAAGNSIPYCVAMALAAGGFEIGFVGDEERRRAGVSRAAHKFRIAYDASLQGARIVAVQPGVGTADVTISAPIGSPSRPMTDAQLLTKFDQCGALSCNPAVRRNRAKIAAAILALEDLPSMRRFASLAREGDA
jgi:2-methylcitrate dehydratase PrpD